MIFIINRALAAAAGALGFWLHQQCTVQGRNTDTVLLRHALISELTMKAATFSKVHLQVSDGAGTDESSGIGRVGRGLR